MAGLFEYTLVGTFSSIFLKYRNLAATLTCIAVVNIRSLPDSSQPVVFAGNTGSGTSNMDLEAIVAIMHASPGVTL